MTILILEDDEERIAFFKEALSEHTLFITDNVEVAKKMVLENEIDTFFLDHDLDHKVYVPSTNPNTGGQFARWLSVENPVSDDIPIYIHSMNGPGAIYMNMWLPQAKVIVYPMLKLQLQELKKR